MISGTDLALVTFAASSATKLASSIVRASCSRRISSNVPRSSFCISNSDANRSVPICNGSLDFDDLALAESPRPSGCATVDTPSQFLDFEAPSSILRANKRWAPKTAGNEDERRLSIVPKEAAHTERFSRCASINEARHRENNLDITCDYSCIPRPADAIGYWKECGLGAWAISGLRFQTSAPSLLILFE